MTDILTESLDPDKWRPYQIFVPAADSLKNYKLLKRLGGGATSIVWQAEEVDSEGKLKRVIALKILRFGQESEYGDAFKDEVMTMAILHSAEDQLGDGRHAIPEIYDQNLQGTPPFYIAMEYIDLPKAVNLGPERSNLPSMVAWLAHRTVVLKEYADQLRSDINLSREIPDHIVLLADGIVQKIESINTDLSSCSTQLEDWIDKQGGLSELDILEIGIQVARLLQLLHQSAQRSYKDFQLTNIYWDQSARTIKVIDWNILTDKGDIRVQDDLLQLSCHLFRLFTHIAIGRGGASPSFLAEKGGNVWKSQISLATRLVLERAFNMDETKRYQAAIEIMVDYTDLKPLSDIHTLGDALAEILKYHQAQVEDLIRLARECNQRKLADDSLAITTIARQRCSHQPADKQSQYHSDIDDLERTSLPASLRSYLEKMKIWLSAADLGKAKTEAEKAKQIQPNDLEVYRWWEVMQVLAGLSLQDFDKLWKKNILQKCMQCMEDRKWEMAISYFKQFRDIDLSNLIADASLHRDLELAEKYWDDFLEDYEIRFIDELSHRMDDIEKGDTRKPPYRGMILQQWPELSQWREQIEKHREKIDDLDKTRESIRKALKHV